MVDRLVIMQFDRLLVLFDCATPDDTGHF